jgi:hypothetical protein
MLAFFDARLAEPRPFVAAADAAGGPETANG